MTNERACANAPSLSEPTVYQSLINIGRLVLAAEILTESCPALDEAGAPPVQYLLELANEEIRALQFRVSD